MSSRAISRVCVLMGGPSAEREGSLMTSREVTPALREEGFEVVELDAGPTLAADLIAAKPDVVFNALHGRWGEDGCVQGVLEWLQIPYTHKLIPDSRAHDSCSLKINKATRRKNSDA